MVIVISENAETLFVEDNESLDEGLPTFYYAIFAENFTIENDSYIFDITVYLENVESNSELYGKNRTLQIRNGLYNNPINNNSGIILETMQYIAINSAEWITFRFNPIFIEKGMYYVYLDLIGDDVESKKDLKWKKTSDSTTGNNASVYYWDNDGELKETYKDNYDCPLKLNISTSPINSSCSAPDLNTYYNHPTTVSVNYTDFVDNNIPNATVRYNISELNLNGMMEDPDGDGIYTKEITLTDLGTYTINFTANRSGFLSSYVTSTITVNKRPTTTHILHQNKVLRGSTTEVSAFLVDDLTSQNLTDATLTCYFISPSYVNLNSSIMQKQSTLHKTTFDMKDSTANIYYFNVTSNKNYYQTSSSMVSFEIYEAQILSSIDSNNNLIMYFEDENTKQQLDTLKIAYTIEDLEGTIVTSGAVNEPNEDGWFIIDLSEEVEPGNYTIVMQLFNNDYFIGTKERPIYVQNSTSNDTTTENTSPSSSSNTLIYLIMMVAVIFGASIGSLSVYRKKHSSLDQNEMLEIEKPDEMKNLEQTVSQNHGYFEYLEHELFDEDEKPQEEQKDNKTLPKSLEDRLFNLYREGKTSKDLDLSISDDRYSSGLPTMDAMLESGIPKKSSTLFITPVCDQKPILIEKLIEKNLDSSTCIYVGETIPVYLESEIGNENMFFVVCDEEINGPNIIKADCGPTSINLAVAKAIRKRGTKHTILILDVMTSFTKTQTLPTIHDFVNALKTKSKSKNMSTVAFINSEVDKEIISEISEIFEGVIDIDNSKEKIVVTVKKFTGLDDHAYGDFPIIAENGHEFWIDLDILKFSKEFKKRFESL